MNHNDNEQKRDYPEVQFTLAGDEGKSPEQLEKEIERIIKLRDLSEKLYEMGWFEDETYTAAQLTSENAEAEKKKAEFEALFAKHDAK